MTNSFVITGASGFIGKAVTKKLLIDNNIVYAVVRNPTKLSDLRLFKNLTIIKSDLENIAQIIDSFKDVKIDFFIHLANSANYPDENQDYIAQLENAKYACDSLNVAIKIGAKKFVLVGSSYQYLYNNNKYYNEFRKCSVYGSVRLAARNLCEVIAHNAGIQFNHVFLTNCFGEGDYSMRSTNAIIRKLLSNEIPLFVEGNNLHDWIYIDDFVRGLILVAELGRNFKSYYIGHRKLISFREIITNLGDVVAPNLKLDFGTNKDKAYIDYSRIDLDAAYEDLGFSCVFNFYDAIINTVSWIKESEISL